PLQGAGQDEVGVGVAGPPLHDGPQCLLGAAELGGVVVGAGQVELHLVVVRLGLRQLCEQVRRLGVPLRLEEERRPVVDGRQVVHAYKSPQPPRWCRGGDGGPPANWSSSPGVAASASAMAVSRGRSATSTCSGPAAVVATRVASPRRRWKKLCRTTQPMIPARSSAVRSRWVVPEPATR